MSHCIVAVTATYRRPAELLRLLQSLAASETSVQAVIVVDNADDLDASAWGGISIPIRLSVPGRNLGCGGGLRHGEQLALAEFPELTHLWILDDDAVIEPSTLGSLLEAMDAESAEVAHPLVIAAGGRIGWFPGLLDRQKFRAIRGSPEPDYFISQYGAAPIPFSWCQGIALLCSRRAIDTLGLHRDDYWVRGEDLEFSLRITGRYRGVYVPSARVQHLPPPCTGGIDRHTEYLKHRAMLQNVAYTGLRLPHGRRIARTLPGNWLRFVRTWGFRPSVLGSAFWAVVKGAIFARPAGADSHPA